MAQVKGIQAEENFAIVKGYKNSIKISSNNAAIVDAAAYLIEDLERIPALDNCIGNLFALLTAAGCVITIVSSNRVEEVM